MTEQIGKAREDILVKEAGEVAAELSSQAGTDDVLPSANIRVPEVATALHPVMHLDLMRVIERMHRRHLDLLRADLMRHGVDDVSPAQVMMLFTIGTGDISVRNLIERGYYLGSNASYSLKRLIEAGYVQRTTSERDRRSARLRLSDKGLELCRLVRTVDQDYQVRLVRGQDQAHDLNVTYRTLVRLEQEWTQAVRYPDTTVP